jgi:ribonucleotide reductase alpha subunit
VAYLERPDKPPRAQQQHRHHPHVEPLHGNPFRRTGTTSPSVTSPRSTSPAISKASRSTGPNSKKPVRTAIRHLDNLIDINILAYRRSARSDQENRAVGLGVMGFSDALEQLSMSYESPHAWDFADRLFEFVSYMAIDESANLARERGAYKNFEGSAGQGHGAARHDRIRRARAQHDHRPSENNQTKAPRLGRTARKSKRRHAKRNLMAVAPNANIGLVAGTTPGIDPRFAQVFSRNKISGKYLDLNHNLVKDLKNMGLWDDLKETIIEAPGRHLAGRRPSGVSQRNLQDRIYDECLRIYRSRCTRTEMG